MFRTVPYFPFYRQADTKDCGPTCLKIIAKSYRKSISLQKLRTLCETSKIGSTLHNISIAAETLGFRSLIVRISYKKLLEAPLPCILFWNKNHYVVIYKIKKNQLYVSDPAYGLLKYTKEEFLERWIGSHAKMNTDEGIALLLEPSPKFYKIEDDNENIKLNLSFILKYIGKYKNFIWQLVLGLFIAGILQFIFPFLTQSIVDIGINNQDIHFIYLILIAQLSLFLGRIGIEVLRSWILLHLTTRINISLVSDFFIKLMNLPISYFDTRMTGDILQRINDHERIENLLTVSSMNVLFSAFNLIVFGFVLAYYNILIFLTFLIGSIFYLFWVVLFLKKRRDLDYKRFSQISQEQSKIIELINGMQTIKNNNSERQKRWGWEFLQAKLFKISIQNLALEQYQNVGSGIINEFKNIMITVLSAKLVIEGEITLGMMLAIAFIVGQLNSPITQLVNFIRELQDARISLERLSEIHNIKDEEQDFTSKVNSIKENSQVELKKLSFKYIGSDKYVLKNLNLVIPANKITAIVGVSGSGKTTLMKLLLKFYEPNAGEIMLGPHKLSAVSHRIWRDNYGVVMQEDYIFNDTIANNIAVGENHIDIDRLDYAADVANITDFIETLPLSYNTEIGMEGIGMSTGQKQRLLIARAVYKNPNYLFFDEATSALDANNEKEIMQKLNVFFHEKTVVVIAHRLSTVKNAHQIVVLDNGKIVERGNHEELVEKRGAYFKLVKNQLELGT